jgi:hypothetical protein
MSVGRMVMRTGVEMEVSLGRFRQFRIYIMAQ